MEYRVIKYAARYLSGLTELLDHSFKIKNPKPEDLIAWKYFGSYLGERTITYVALDNKDRIVGQYTNRPINIVRDGTLYKAMVCADMTTHSQHRGRGLIGLLSRQVYKDVTAEGYEFTIGFSNNEGVKVDKNSKSYGYEIVGKFECFFKMLWLKPDAKFSLKITTDMRIPDEAKSGAKFFHLQKNYEYLKWRYLEKPFNDYLIYEINNNKSHVGCVVIRKVGKKCYINDVVFWGKGPESFWDEVLAAIEQKMFEEGRRIMIYNVLANKFWKGLLERRQYVKKVVNSKSYFFTIKIHNPDLDREKLLDKENWWLINGDIL